MSESLSLRFLYHTACGRAVLKLLVRPGLSRAAGKFLDSKCSKIFIRGFQKRNGISLDGIEVPEGGFPSFNSFFCRKRSHSAVDEDPGHLISPCDGLLSVHTIDADSRLAIKNTTYSLAELLQDAELADSYRGGKALIFRLMPTHYHRYAYADSGIVLRQKRIEGVLHTVRPIATEQVPVYVQNSREYALLQSEQFGSVVQMEVGALLVGRITNLPTNGFVTRGEERGYFEFGGSTIVLLLQRDRVRLLPAYNAEQEIPVTLGQQIGEKV